MDIKRDKYLNDLINRMHNGMIKVVTGIRRCGKSYLLFNIFKNYLLEHGVTASHIITIELDQRKNKKYRDPDTILDYIESLIEDDEQYYIMENIIYNELRSRGYTVDIGVVEKRGTDENGKEYKNQLEIDFVANLGSKRYYIQSAFSMPTEEKRIQEKASLVNVNDSFKKIIVVKDVVNVTRDEDGITTMSIYDFLLKENSLEL